MTRKELIDDMNFRTRCCEYGLDWLDFEIYDDVIMLHTPKSGIYVLLDNNYNVMGIHVVEPANIYPPNEYIARTNKMIYNKVDEREGRSFSSPFQNFSLKQIVDAASSIEIRETNHGHSSELLINGLTVNDNLSDNYLGLLSYIKFLGEQIKQYFLNAYHMKMMGFEYPDVYSYINRIMYNIDECLRKNAGKDRVLPIDIIEYLGQNRKTIDKYNHHLYKIIDLLIKERQNFGEEDLSTLAQDVLKAVECSNEEEAIARQRQKKQ